MSIKHACISIPEIASPVITTQRGSQERGREERRNEVDSPISGIQRIIIKVFTAVKNDLIVYVLHFL